MSLFISIYYMYFPFLICEVKYGAAALDVADRQNTYSITIALRGVIDLFRLMKREKELNREILAFSISICSVINDLPLDPDFEVSEQSEPGESGLSQGLDSYYLSDQSIYNTASLLEEAGSQSSRVNTRDITRNTLLSQENNGKTL
ncbi:uncharacterized protein RAG0_07810 [Rhynchosporium agropyri]|uniref:DUF7924 domain-containing protein n=1 Tax=Rhynchosporium agropyri TaxID=914238 RepID=A0A1E1KN81_9HELO|nr:uncharacterized protein RAG0_07810 [Rhynchosporium agropyri]